jgi:putative sulfurtransferase DndC
MATPVNKNWTKFASISDLTDHFVVSGSSKGNRASRGRHISEYISEIHELYSADARPWVVGFSGGKDSTAVLQLIYIALLRLPPEQRKKPVFVVSSDTLVETPLVVSLVVDTLARVDSAAQKHGIPLTCHKVVPRIDESFWVNLLGKGYPAPTKQFRWCTERLKIDPVSDFIVDRVTEYNEVIVVLGSRKEESTTRAQVIDKHKRAGSRLAVHTTLANAYIYTPIEDWSVQDVWDFLNGAEDFQNPWGGSNYPLWDLYQGSSAGECPLVIDASTPSCGNSRFGCWVCTVVKKDRAMEALIDNGETWMQPLLDFRNMLSHTTAPENKNEFRNFKRRTGRVTYTRANGSDEDTKHIPGPYWMKYRQEWLRELLTIERSLSEQGHPIQLISELELHAIRNEWKKDPNEPDWTDSLPALYREVYGRDLEWIEDDAGTFTKPDADLLDELGASRGIPAELLMKLLELELAMDGLSKRNRIFDRIHDILKQDWGTLDEINKRNASFASDTDFDERILMLRDEYEGLRT